MFEQLSAIYFNTCFEDELNKKFSLVGCQFYALFVFKEIGNTKCIKTFVSRNLEGHQRSIENSIEYTKN